MPKVSVVVPVYGVEKYIERCVRSLFEQTLDDIEFIFVDDCTPDRSIEILERLIVEYKPRIEEKNFVVQIERMPVNSGQAIVRKRGIQLCTGDYIAHCDSDDWVERDIYQKLYEKAVVEHADVVICDFVLTDGVSSKNIVASCHSEIPIGFIENCLLRIDSWSLCNKLFRNTVYSNVTYPSGAMGEDMVLVIQLMHNCNKMSYIQEPLYNYVYNPNSITKKSTKDVVIKKFEQLSSNSHIVIDFLEKEKLKTRMESAIVVYKNFVRSVLYPLVWDRKYYKIWNEMFPGLNRQVLLSRNISFLEKLRVILTILHLYPRRQFMAK